MDNPIILLVIWALINVFTKSAKDKKKIEAAKRKRAQRLGNLTQLNNQTLYNKRSDTAKTSKSLIDIFKEEIEKELQRAKQGQIPVQKVEMPSDERENITVTEKIEDEYINFEDISNKDIQMDIKPEIVERESKEVLKNTNKQNQVFDLKNDILKGIVYAEILSEPKSIKNMKRSM